MSAVIFNIRFLTNEPQFNVYIRLGSYQTADTVSQFVCISFPFHIISM